MIQQPELNLHDAASNRISWMTSSAKIRAVAMGMEAEAQLLRQIAAAGDVWAEYYAALIDAHQLPLGPES